MSSHPAVDPQADSRFATTRWSVVVAARQSASPDARQALASLCQTYWFPLYAFVRRQGYHAAHAQDLVQEFFARLLEKDTLQSADRERGRFRTFLLVVFKRFLANQRQQARAQKRGGGQPLLSLDFASAEQRLQREPACHATPEQLFRRRWALTLLDTVLSRLNDEYQAKGKGPLFDALRDTLAGADHTPYAVIAEPLQMTEGAVKVAVFRLRKRYRELLRDEIAQTVESEDEVDAELDDLLSALVRE